MDQAFITEMQDARCRTLALVENLSDEQLCVQYSPNVNPFLWELGHVAFFYDAFVRGYALERPPLMRDGARLYDSFRVDHDDRWALPLPTRTATLDYLDAVATALPVELGDASERTAYCQQLAVLHEDMHGEAFAYMRNYSGYPRPALGSAPQPAAGAWPGDVDLAGGVYQLGAVEGQAGFVFDNEKWAHPVEVAAFRIARAPVTNAEYLEFVEAGGYQQESLWSFDGWVWRHKAAAEAPLGWVSSAAGWQRRVFDQCEPLRPHQPVVHVGFHEAEAYCSWAGRRLPSEAEWEMAASFEPGTSSKRRYPWGDAPWCVDRANLDYAVGELLDVAACPTGDSASGCRQMLGNVWEWTAAAFYPFPGYLVDRPYREYSAPWFGYRKVLRGGAFASRSRLIHNTYRNFFTPDRRDLFAGFRTCAR